VVLSLCKLDTNTVQVSKRLKTLIVVSWEFQLSVGRKRMTGLSKEYLMLLVLHLRENLLEMPFSLRKSLFSTVYSNCLES
jgi:hypothetical protein